MDREIWFEKILWSYIPCHRKGWAVLFAFALFTFCGIGFGEWAIDALGRPDADWLPWLIFFVPSWLAVMAIAKRHS